MNGEIWIEGDEKAGSIFCFTAAFATAAADKTTQDFYPDIATRNHSQACTSASKKVLIVEDDSTSRMLIDTLLKNIGITVLEAENGQQALNILASSSVDLVVMDIQMPVLDGMTATKMIRQQEKSTGARVPIIAMTAYALPDDKEQFLAAGMNDYMSKPIDVDHFLKLVEEYLISGAQRAPETIFCKQA